jgi:type IV pilus assembly protein PilN
MPQINLLPWREADRKRKRQEFTFAAIGALVLAALVGLIVNWELGSAIDHQNERNQLLKGEIAQLDKQITEILGLEQQKQRLVARMEVIDQLQRSRPGVVHLFDQLVKTLPDGVYLTAIKQTDRRIQLKGVAQSSTRVSAFMRNIDGSQWLADPALEIVETKGASDNGAEFTLYANQSGLPTEEDSNAKGKRKPAKGSKAGARS